jgi:hypothetical protein
MSDGMSDAAAEGRIYREVWCAVFDLREVLRPVPADPPLLWSSPVVSKVNELIEDLGWCFERAQYAATRRDPACDAEKVWDAVAKLRVALRHQTLGHRGWSCAVDATVDGLLRGSGYLLRQVRPVWLESWSEP